VDRLAERLYPGCRTGRPSPVDGTVAFYQRLLDRLPAEATVLDFGAGRGAAFAEQRPGVRELVRLKPKLARRIGVDINPAVLENAELDEAHVLTAENGYRIPLPDASVDAVLADWVLEHLHDPLRSLTECRRVLKSGGIFAARTPNRWHYIYILSRAIGSRRLGRTLLRISQPARRSEDIFETHYRANTPGQLRGLLKDAGFTEVDILTHEAEPLYMMFSRVTLLLGWAYASLAQRGLLPRAALFAFARL